MTLVTTAHSSERMSPALGFAFDELIHGDGDSGFVTSLSVTYDKSEVSEEIWIPSGWG